MKEIAILYKVCFISATIPHNDITHTIHRQAEPFTLYFVLAARCTRRSNFKILFWSNHGGAASSCKSRAVALNHDGEMTRATLWSFETKP